jgi:hypothetical protein
MSLVEPSEKNSTEALESGNSVKHHQPVLVGSIGLVFANQFPYNLRGDMVMALARSLGSMIIYIPMTLLGYLIAKAVTKTVASRYLVHCGILVAYWAIAPMLQRYGSGGRFF